VTLLLSINADHHCQVGWIACSNLQNRCQPHYHAVDSVQIIGCLFISLQILYKILIVLAMVGRYIKIEKVSVGKWCIYTYPSGTPSKSDIWAPSSSPGGAGGPGCIPGGNGISWSGLAPLSLHCLCVWRFFTVPFLQRRQLTVRFEQPKLAGILLQPSLFYAQETQVPESSLVGL